MRIRRAVASDAPDAARILRSSITDLCTSDHGDDATTVAAWTANKTPDQVRSWLNAGQDLFLVAEIDGQLAGVGQGAPGGEILLNYVAPRFRFQGVSRALLRRLEAEIAARGQTKGHLTSTETALRFYRSEGWHPDGPPIRDRVGTGYPMAKNLPEIRLLTPDDAPLWREIRLNALKTEPGAFSSRHADWVDRPLSEFTAHLADHRIFAALLEGTPVGCARWSRFEDGLCYVTSVFVKPGLRGRGLAAALMAAITHDARTRGARSLYLDVGRGNRAAQQTYQAAGFQTVPDAERPSASCEACEVTMRLTL